MVARLVNLLTAVLAATDRRAEPDTPRWQCARDAEPRAAGCPLESDVMMRSVSPHYTPQPGHGTVGAGNGLGLYDTWGAAAAFHANRIDWVYSNNASFVSDAKQHGMRSVQLTINANLPDTHTNTSHSSTYLAGRMLNVHGVRIGAPWMQQWSNPPKYGCINNPAYIDIVQAVVRSSLADGAISIQHDDPATNGGGVSWNKGAPNASGCYCQYCMAGFTAALTTGPNALNATMLQRLNVSQSFNYKEYLLTHNLSGVAAPCTHPQHAHDHEHAQAGEHIHDATCSHGHTPQHPHPQQVPVDSHFNEARAPPTGPAVLAAPPPPPPPAPAPSWAAATLRQLFVSFQLNSSAKYVASIRSFITNIKPGTPLSCNNGGRWTTPYDQCDYGVGELSLTVSLLCLFICLCVLAWLCGCMLGVVCAVRGAPCVCGWTITPTTTTQRARARTHARIHAGGNPCGA